MEIEIVSNYLFGTVVYITSIEIKIETSTKMYTPFFNRIKLKIWTICAFRVLFRRTVIKKNNQPEKVVANKSKIITYYLTCKKTNRNNKNGGKWLYKRFSLGGYKMGISGYVTKFPSGNNFYIATLPRGDY